MKKTIKTILVMAIIWLSCLTSIAFTNNDVRYEKQVSASIGKETRRPIIEWKYKFANNKMYQRQYNYTTGEWIGEWELCK